jgi:IS30 family transposase
VFIDTRPVIVDCYHVLAIEGGGDTIIALGRQSAFLTLVERKTLYTVVMKLDGKHAGH